MDPKESQSDLSALKPTTVLCGDFELIRSLGEGGMGVVWLARERSLQRDVALKIMRPSAHDQLAEKRLKRFEQEAAILAKAEHPSILPVFRFCRDDATGLSFYTMKPCLLTKDEVIRLCDDILRCPRPKSLPTWDLAPKALSLHDLLSGGKVLPQEAVAKIGMEIVAALKHAHGLEPPIIHRDIKPSNILFAPDGSVLLTDFGVAKVLDECTPADLSVDEEGKVRFFGTPFYAAPEQYDTRTIRGISPAADYYSLGAVLYEALTAHRPVSLESPSSFDSKTISKEWDTLLFGMLAQDSDRRLADPDEITKQLQRISRSRQRRKVRMLVFIMVMISVIAQTATVIIPRLLPNSSSWHLVAQYDFSGDLADSSGHDYSLRASRKPVEFVTDRFGNTNAAVWLDDENTLIAEKEMVCVKDSFTFSCWLKPNVVTHLLPVTPGGVCGAAPGIAYLAFSQYDVKTKHSGICIAVGANGVNLFEHNTYYLPACVCFHTNISTDHWTHLAVTVSDNSAPKLYLNGKLADVGFNSMRPKQFLIDAQKFGLGGGKYGFFCGAIDDVKIYSKALSEQEIAKEAAN